jgi:hypothetical protein
MKVSLLIVLSFLFLSLSGYPGDGKGKNSGSPKSAREAISISGNVEDITNSEKLVCAKIEIEELDKTLFTDIMGNYTIENVKPGTYTLKVSYISYEELNIEEMLIGQKTELNIRLKPL